MNAVDRLVLRTVDAVPRALTPAWAHDTWSGTFGRNALEVRLTGLDAAVRLDDGLHGTVHAAGRIGHGGDVERTLSVGPEGALVQHGRLFVDADDQHQGFGTAYVQHGLARYADAGVDAVRTYASGDVGGWAWHRAGFQLDDDLVREHFAETDDPVGAVVATIVDDAVLRGDITDAQGDAARAAGPRSMAQLAALPFGRELLLRSAWPGVLPLHPSAGSRPAPRPAARDAAEAVRQLLPPQLDHDLALGIADDAVFRAGWASGFDDATTATVLELAPAPAARTETVLPVEHPSGARAELHVYRDLRPGGDARSTVWLDDAPDNGPQLDASEGAALIRAVHDRFAHELDGTAAPPPAGREDLREGARADARSGLASR